MSNFIQMRDKLTAFIENLMNENNRLFNLNIDKDKLYNSYLSSMSKELNPFFRKATEHDCSCCRGFIKSMGGVIAIKDNKAISIWDCDVTGTGYEHTFEVLSKYVHENLDKIQGVFIAQFKEQGCHHNFEELEKVGPHRWDHFFVELDAGFYDHNNDHRNKKMSDINADHQVFKRALDEITLNAIDSVLDLISTNTLYRGEEYRRQIDILRNCKIGYDKLKNDLDKNLYSWEKVIKIDSAAARVRNSAIGTLLLDISIGVDLNDAVTAYEKIVAPENYKRSKPLFTKGMLENAQKKIQELGFENSLPRRHATLADLTINDVLFADRTVTKSMKDGADIFGQLAKEVKGGNNTNKFSGTEEITPEKFISEVLPKANKLEVYLENQHKSKLVSLIAPQNPEAKSMFKWGNNFTWAYTGNVTDSIKERVKSAGGNVEGVLRFSIQWNEDGNDNCDLDAHCKEPNNDEIFYSTYRKDRGNCKSLTGGQLDVDVINPGGKVAVENIYWGVDPKIKGEYKFFVHQFSGSVKNGFRAQIEMAGQVYEFNYPHSMRSGEKVKVADVNWDGNKYTIKTHIDSSSTPKKIWGIETLDFVPVQLVCYSPNFWETAETQVGHKHLFFMLKGAVNDECPSGIFNEFLVSELSEVRKVMEAIANKMRVGTDENQLSGIGFAFDQRAEVTVRVTTDATQRLLRIKF